MTTFAALGDSITLGVGDPAPGGGWRGWAAFLAQGLPGGHLVNLAANGARAADVERVQLPRALELRPDVASVIVGTNDILRAGFDVARIQAALAHVAGSLSAAGAGGRHPGGPAPRVGRGRGAGQAAGPPPPGDQRGHGPGGRAVRHAALRCGCRAGDLRTADVERGPAAPERAGSPLHRRLLPRPARRARPSGGPAPGRRADQPGADPVRHGRVDGDQRHGLGAAPKDRPAALPAFHGSTPELARPWPAPATAAAGGGATSRRGPGSRPGEQARAMTRPPRITVFGTGYLGAAHAACLASLGLDVLGVDIDAARVGAL